MKKVLLLAVLFATFAAITSAQDEAEYSKWMKDTGAAVASLRKNLDAKSGDAAAADAKKLETIFGQVQSFWQKKNVSDAAKVAGDAQSGFKSVAELAAAGNFEGAGEALKIAQATCGTCHQAHREKAADGSYKIK